MSAEPVGDPSQGSAQGFVLGVADAAVPKPARHADHLDPRRPVRPARKPVAPAPPPVPLLSLLRNVEFRILTVTQFLSIAGDQLARVALSVLVFNRTNSALQAAITYALTFVPAAIGGPLLAGLADRRPRKSVMVAADLIRAPLIGLLAIPSMPLPLALVLLAIAGLFEAPFDAARGALLPDVLHGDRFTSGYAMTQITIQAAQVGGFGLGGVLLIAFSPSTLLIIDAVTFVASAALIARVVAYRPAADHGREDSEAPTRPTRWWHHAISDLRTSVRIVLRAPNVRPLALLAWSTATFAIAFEALGAPLAADSNSGSWTVGILLASQPVGTVAGALLAARIREPRREPIMKVLALVVVVPLIAGLLRPPLAALVGIGVVSGLGMSFNVLASTAFVRRVAADVRGRALGLVGTGLLVGQGVGVLVAGGLASAIDTREAVGWLGVAGTLAVVATLVDATRSQP